MALSDEAFMQQLMATFAVEAQENLHVVSQGLLVLEDRERAGDTGALLAEMFRAAHSLKGAARAVGAEEIAILAHHLESRMGEIRSGALPIEAVAFDVLYQTVDALGALVQALAGGEQLSLPLDTLVERLIAGPTVVAMQQAAASPQLPDNATLQAPAETGSKAIAPEAPDRPQPPVAAPSTVAANPQDANGAGRRPRTAASEESVRVSTGKLDAIIEQVGELQVARLANEVYMRRLAALVDELEQAAADLRKVPAAGRNPQNPSPSNDNHKRPLGVLVAELRRLRGDMSASGRHEAQLVDDLEEYVLHTRLMPVATVLETFPRMVRDLAHDLGKQVRLTIEGGDTEVDRSVLEQIKAPLTHLLRNAVDHGIEAPAARIAAGKPAEGHIKVTAAQRGSTVVIDVQDDGQGIDSTGVRAAAVRRGVVDTADLDRMSEQDIMWLIFHPGMSTRAEVTDVSGRGVGLDVVRTHVEHLRGYIALDSARGHGTHFALHLPLSVATTLCLLVECSGQLFAFPTSGVFRATRVPWRDIGRAEGRDVVRIGDRLLALHDLADMLALPPPAAPALADGVVYALLVGVGEQRVALAVDAVHEVQELVVKPLPPPLSHVQHIAGASNLGTGEIALVLNIADLVRAAGQRGAHRPERQRAGTPEATSVDLPTAPPTVLVADDSFTTRSLVRNILETAGYTVRVAADGLEAWVLLQSEPVDLVVSDVMMPNMTGFELTNKIRDDKRLCNVPVVLVTAQESAQDREQGLAVGADAYLVKSAFDQDNLLATIERLI